jgi:hypothetical protein
MAIKVSAPGNAPSIKQKTPAPDQVTNIRAPGGQGYGENGAANPSSVAPGKRVVSQLGANLESSVDDPARDEIIAKGTARDLNVGDSTGRTLAQQGGDALLRDLAASGTGHGTKGRPSPVHSSMASRAVDEGSPGGAVPSGIDKSATAEPVRKPS